MTGTTDQPTLVRQLDIPAARELADLAAVLDDLQTVLQCCERLVTDLADPSGSGDDVVREALWTTAVLSYTRCFTDSRGGREGRPGTVLTEDDVTATSLQGEVLEWHKVLRRVRRHYADPATNPREQFSVGVAQDSRGQANGIAITSTRQPALDDLTVRQTGALAYELSQLVDQRMTEHQRAVAEAAEAMSKNDLDRLPTIDLATS